MIQFRCQEYQDTEYRHEYYKTMAMAHVPDEKKNVLARNKNERL
jgi:hypothetical protein